MDPFTESLLQDLFDDRLPPDEAADLRQRIESEPALGEAWEDLHRLRRLVVGDARERAPADFLSRVRARIAAGETAGATPPAAHPRWRGLGILSAAAALVLTALAARLFFLESDAVPPGEDIRESAVLVFEEADEDKEELRIPDARNVLGDEARARLRERQAEHAPEAVRDAEAEGARGGAPAPAAPVTPAVPVAEAAEGAPSAGRAGELGAPAPASPRAAPVPVRAAGPRFGPGDAVPPGLRRPSDDETPQPGFVAPTPRVRRSTRRGPPADATFHLRAAALDEGRAALALLLAGLTPPPAAAEAGDDEVLGSFLVVLSPGDASRLVGHGVSPKARSKDARVATRADTPVTVRVVVVRPR